MSSVGAKDTVNSVCRQCGAEFRCGMEGGDAQCWCAGLPPFMPLPDSAAAPACLCPACLQARLRLAGGTRVAT